MTDWSPIHEAPEDGTHIIVSHEELGEVEMYFGKTGGILDPGWITVPGGVLCPRVAGYAKFKGWKHKTPPIPYSDITKSVV